MTNLLNITNSAEKAEKKPATDSSTKVFIEANVAMLKEGLSLLRKLDDGNYNADCRPAFRSTVGAHFRHLLEHYQCFLKSFESGTVCYDSRARDGALEQNRAYAIEVMEHLISQLDHLNTESSVLANTVSALYVNDQQSPETVESTLQREVLFLQSHTVHHYAMIAAMCRIHGIEVAENFGVAIATQVFEANNRCPDPLKEGLSDGGKV